ncbi:MAG: ribosome-associated translation inhibitor RaiA [Alphaproteobacteria bacterium]|nr:ribosome-associated translation inhibitor RaiA [Alphaproteobacteria bacterium]
MQISISGKNMDTGDAFQEHAETALSSAVSKYFDNAISGSITLIKSTTGFETRVRVNLSRRIEMEAMGKAGDAHQSLDQAVEHIEKRLRRYKRRLKNHRADNDDTIPATMTYLEVQPDHELPEEASAPPVLAEMDYHVHLMTVEEAVMVLELSGQSALMFRNKAHMGLNMLHRRDDGSIGWVDPRGNR